MRADTVPVDIAVFARAPVAGQAKTRLIPRLGAEGAARLQQRLIEDALARAAALPGARVTLWTTGTVDDAATFRTAQAMKAGLRIQRGPDLGARMANAVAQTLDGQHPMLLIGTDCPAQTVDDLRAALRALDDADAVVQPAEDGGYVMIGMKRPHLGLFERIAWGSGAVLAGTRARAGELGLRLAELPTSWDVDRPEDFDRAVALGLVQPGAA